MRLYRHALTAAEVATLAEQTSSNRLRVITWNLKQSSSSTAEQQAALLLTHNPDVILTHRSSELTTTTHAVMPHNSLSDHRMVGAEFAVP